MKYTQNTINKYKKKYSISIIIRRIFLTLIVSVIVVSCSNDDTENEQIGVLNFTGPMRSCSDFVIAKSFSDEFLNIILTIRGAGKENLNLDTGAQLFTLPNDKLNIEVSRWDGSVIDHFCNDVLTGVVNELESWNAISGIVEISVPEIGDSYYYITIHLKNILFVSDTGVQQIIKSLKIENAVVGWLPG